MQSVSIVELPQGGWRLRVSEVDGNYRMVGRYATATDAARVARTNGYSPVLDTAASDSQLEFPFSQTGVALSA